MSDYKVGTPNDDFEAPRAKRKLGTYFDIEEGSNIYRILPPFGTLAEEGVWAVKTVSHWGYRGTNGKSRVFACLGSDCPECALVEDVKSKLEAATSEEERVMLKEFISNHNLDIKHNMNALSKENKIGLLRVKTRMWQDFGRERKALKQFGIHPADAAKGVWIDFSKSGQGSNAVWKATAVKEEALVNGEVVSKLKLAPLSEDVLARMQEEAFDLTRSVRHLTLDQVQSLVGSVVDYTVDPEVVDAVFSSPTKVTVATESEVSPVSAPTSTHSVAMSDEQFARTFGRK